MKIRVDWFKDSGKWYSGGLVEIGETMIWQPEFKQAIVDNQDELLDTWVDHEYYVVCSNTKEQDDDPEFKGFHHVLFKPDAFAGMKKAGGRP